jgi:hypothetical protein
VEGINKIITGELISLSEQELVDCDSDNHGCNGGLMEDAFNFIKQIGGLTSENTYPYRAKEEPCDSNKVKMTYSVNNNSNFYINCMSLMHMDHNSSWCCR